MDWHPIPKSWASWLRLCKIAPALNYLHRSILLTQRPPPKRMSNAAFLQLAATFDDNTTRAALRQLIVDVLQDKDKETRSKLRELILDLIKDDLVELLTRIMEEREHGWIDHR